MKIDSPPKKGSPIWISSMVAGEDSNGEAVEPIPNKKSADRRSSNKSLSYRLNSPTYLVSSAHYATDSF